MSDREAAEERNERAERDGAGAGERAGEEAVHGDAATENPMAPASAGIPHGHDRRPESPETRRDDEADETPVRSPVERGGVGSGSAAAASKAAGSAGPGGEAGDAAEEED